MILAIIIIIMMLIYPGIVVIWDQWTLIRHPPVSFVTSASRRLDKKEDFAVPGINVVYAGKILIYACKNDVKYTTMSSKWVLILILGLFLCMEEPFLVIFKKLGFTPCKAEQPLRDMESQENEAQKD